MIHKNDSAISFSADGWSTNDLRGVYCNTITCHFINQQWELTELILDVSDLEQRHTSVNLLEKWSKVSSSFNLKENSGRSKRLFIS